MDANIVREVEFSRKMRGYDMGQVDAFLEEVEAMLRRRDLERENLQHKLEELSGARDAQSEKLSILNGQILLTQEENEKLTEKIQELTQALEKKDARIQELERRLEEAKKQPMPVTTKAPVVPVEEKPEKAASREELQKRFSDATTAAKDSLKQMSQSLKSLRKK